MTALLIALGVFAVLLAGFLFLVFPAKKKHGDLELLKGAYIAHRGLHDLEPNTPENSLPAFDAAAKQGYIIENDIHITADGEVVVFHDDNPVRMCGAEGKIEEMTLAEIKTLRLLDTDLQIPTLKECLDLVDGRVPLLIEFKCEDSKTCERLCVAANEILKEYKGKYFVQSFYPFAVGWYKKHRKDICRGQLSAAFKGESLVKRMLGCTLFNFIARPHFLSYCHNDEKHPCRRLNTKLGAFPVGWTFKSQQEVDTVKDKFNTYIFEGFIPEE
ncbi:MAG: glycerophosphodiester phosphodiesterase [Clostridia bacterium]|nr:glycerophosphodiester phosphodiesterase [Clostridia bacterium]